VRLAVGLAMPAQDANYVSFLSFLTRFTRAVGASYYSSAKTKTYIAHRRNCNVNNVNLHTKVTIEFTVQYSSHQNFYTTFDSLSGKLERIGILQVDRKSRRSTVQLQIPLKSHGH